MRTFQDANFGGFHMIGQRPILGATLEVLQYGVHVELQEETQMGVQRVKEHLAMIALGVDLHMVLQLRMLLLKMFKPQSGRGEELQKLDGASLPTMEVVTPTDSALLHKMERKWSLKNVSSKCHSNFMGMSNGCSMDIMVQRLLSLLTEQLKAHGQKAPSGPRIQFLLVIILMEDGWRRNLTVSRTDLSSHPQHLVSLDMVRATLLLVSPSSCSPSWMKLRCLMLPQGPMCCLLDGIVSRHHKSGTVVPTLELFNFSFLYSTDFKDLLI